MRRLTLITLLTIGLAVFNVHAQDVKTIQLDAFVIPSGGQVNDLRFYGQPARSGSCTVGTAYYDTDNDRLEICDNAGSYTRINGIWRRNGWDYYTDHYDQAIRVGFGTNTPTSLIHGMGDGDLVMEGSFGLGRTITPNGSGTRLIWNPRKAAFRVGGVSGTQWDDTNVGNYSIGGGRNVTVDADYSVAFGDGNFIHSADPNSVISGGTNNAINESGLTANKGYNTIGGGRSHSIDSEDSTIGGGNNNTIVAGTADATIGGGQNNTIGVNTLGATIGGGLGNTADGWDTPWVGGGSGNTATGNLAGGGAVGGGTNNTAGGAEAGVFAGENNRSWAPQAFVGGGIGNDNESPYGVIAGGWYNSAGKTIFISTGAAIGGGLDNVVEGDVGGVNAPSAGTIAGGQKNSVTASWGTIAGGGSDVVGEGNTVTARYASVGGGRNNDATALYAVISGGQNNIASGAHSVVPGGQDNIAGGDFSWAGGKNMQLTAAADETFIWGYSDSVVTVPTPNAFIVYNANVGVGVTAPTKSLHIKDVMKLEPQAAPPDCDEPGLLYTNSTAPESLCFCADGGGIWQNLNGGATCN